MTLLLPTDHEPVEVDMSGDPCRPRIPTTATILTVTQLHEVANEGVPVYLYENSRCAGCCVKQARRVLNYLA
jgi:hypothetical protein